MPEMTTLEDNHTNTLNGPRNTKYTSAITDERDHNQHFEQLLANRANSSLDDGLKHFLREVASDFIKVNMLHNFARLAATGYCRVDGEWKTVIPAAHLEKSATIKALPADGYHAASFPSTRESADALSYSEHSIYQAAHELHFSGALTYCASFGDADIGYMDVQASFSANLSRTHSFAASVV
jgi:hypothetical protein